MGKTRKEIKEQIMAKQVQVKPNEIPENWSEEAADFVNKVNCYLLYIIYFIPCSAYRGSLRIDLALKVHKSLRTTLGSSITRGRSFTTRRLKRHSFLRLAITSIRSTVSLRIK